MDKKILNFFEIAARTAQSKSDRRNFLLGAIGVRSDGVMVRSLNSPTEKKNGQAHAEAKLSRKLDFNSVVYVARVRMDTYKFGMARPCPSCFRILSAKKVIKIFYTIDEYSYGVINLVNNSEKIYHK